MVVGVEELAGRLRRPRYAWIWVWRWYDTSLESSLMLIQVNRLGTLE